MKGAGGFARVYRRVFGHPALRTSGEEAAFIWLFTKAAWQPTRVRYKGKAIHLKRGELALSLRDFATGFGWTIGFVQRFTDRLKSESMIDTRSDSGVNVITICNYSTFQDALNAIDSPRDSPRDSKSIQKRDTEQRNKESKPSPTPSKEGAKTGLPKDWTIAIADLPPMAKEAASKWPAGLYEKEAEKFIAWAIGGKILKADWRLTFGKWILTADDRLQEGRRGWRGNGDEPRPLWEQKAEERRRRKEGQELTLPLTGKP